MMEGRRGAEGPGILAVYNADGGVAGELRYVWGKIRGTAHCSLCDITHSPVRRKKAWDALVDKFPLPVVVRHRNEADPRFSARGLPAVWWVDPGGEERLLAGPADLDPLEGDEEGFFRLLTRRLETM